MFVLLTMSAAGCSGGDERAGTSAEAQAQLATEHLAIAVRPPAVGDRDDVSPVLTPRWRWTSPDGGNVGLPASDERGVVTTHTERFLVALAPTGELQWSVEHRGIRPVEPLLAGDLVVAAGEDDIVAVERATGDARWTTAIGHERANAPVLAGDATVIVTTWEGRLLALDRVTGVVRWSRVLDGPSLWRPAANARHVVAVWDGGWGAFAAADGSAVWSEELYPEGIGSPAIVTAEDVKPVAVVTSGGRIDANELATGRARWRSTIWVDTAIDQGVSAALGSGGGADVAVPDREGGVTVLDAATGRVQWFRAGGEGDRAQRGSPVPVGDGLSAFALDVGGVRLAWAGGHRDFDAGGPVAGVARLGAGVVVTTWQTGAPAVVAIDVLTRAPSG